MNEEQLLQRLDRLEAENARIHEILNLALTQLDTIKQQFSKLELSSEYDDEKERFSLDIQQMETMLSKAFLTVSETCMVLGQSRMTVLKHIHMGSLKAVDLTTTPGTKPAWRVRSDSVRKLLKLDEALVP